MAVQAGSVPFASAQNGAGAMLQTSIEQLRKNFIAADKDKDGFLTREEAQAGYTPIAARNFDSIDKTHSGKISEKQIEDYLTDLARAKAASHN
jgi:Ca2+-binding EF-hand superfamily protein